MAIDADLLHRFLASAEWLQFAVGLIFFGSLRAAWVAARFVTNLERDQRAQDKDIARITPLECRVNEIEKRINSRIHTLDCPSQPSTTVSAPKDAAEIVPIRDEYREPSLADERRRKPGKIGDLYSSGEDRIRAEMQRQRRARKAAKPKEEPRSSASITAAQVQLPLDLPDKLTG